MLVCIIEDNMVELQETTGLITDEFGADSEVRSAGSVEEGHEILTRARERGECFDVIILDLRLPQSRGESELKFDPKLPKLARSLFPNSTLIARTAYATSAPRIMMQGADLVISKTSPDATQELIQAMLEYPIIQRFRAIFGVVGQENIPWRGRRFYESGGSLTLELNSLIADILKNYEKLSDEAREEINECIRISNKNGIYVSEYLPEPSHAERKDDV